MCGYVTFGTRCVSAGLLQSSQSFQTSLPDCRRLFYRHPRQFCHVLCYTEYKSAFRKLRLQNGTIRSWAVRLFHNVKRQLKIMVYGILQLTCIIHCENGKYVIHIVYYKYYTILDNHDLEDSCIWISLLFLFIGTAIKVVINDSSDINFSVSTVQTRRSVQPS